MTRLTSALLLFALLASSLSACGPKASGQESSQGWRGALASQLLAPAKPPIKDRASERNRRVAAAAMSQVGKTTSYDPAYAELDYPGGDVPIETGVCTDVAIRALRAAGADLQVKVHEDMTEAFDEYPRLWDLSKPDPNIDHRRVPNLQTYFTRTRKSLPISKNGADYQPGDLVTWTIFGRPHIGVVSTSRSSDGQRFLITHNIGGGVKTEDYLFAHPITGHSRYFE